MIGYFTDLHMLDHLPYDVRLITDLVNHLRQLPVNIALLERASGLANRYLYSLEINLTVTSAVITASAGPSTLSCRECLQ